MALFGLVWARAQWITADWARGRRHSGVTLVMATSFLVAWGIPAQQKSTKSDHTYLDSNLGCRGHIATAWPLVDTLYWVESLEVEHRATPL